MKMASNPKCANTNFIRVDAGAREGLAASQISIDSAKAPPQYSIKSDWSDFARFTGVEFNSQKMPPHHLPRGKLSWSYADFSLLLFVQDISEL